MSGPAVVFDRVSVVFGDAPERALPAMDRGLDRAGVRAETGQVLGVHDCTLDVGHGETLVLMGLSGSGKSTLLRTVNALNPVARGRVLVDAGEGPVEVTGADTARLRRLRRGGVAMVFQQFGLLPWRDVLDNVALGLELAGLSRAERTERARRKLDLVGLSGSEHRKVAELSGGMQQRVGLARALAGEAPILLMDEPFSALDPLIRTRLQDELSDIQARLRRTIVFVSHDLDEAFKLGDRIALMEDGRLVQIGTPREILSAPATDYVAAFVANLNPLAVVRVADAMHADTAGLDATAPSIEADARLQDIVDRLAGHDGPLRVVRGGESVGKLGAAEVVAALAGARG